MWPWPKYGSFSVSLSSEYSGLISFRVVTWWSTVYLLNCGLKIFVILRKHLKCVIEIEKQALCAHSCVSL